MDTAPGTVKETPALGRVLDLRGRSGTGVQPRGVLEDPSGRRRAHLRRVGRAVSLLLLLWLVALVLGGLGLVPVPGLPRLISLRPSSGPPAVATRPRPRPAQPADRVAARPSSSAPAAAGGPAAEGRRAAAPRLAAKRQAARRPAATAKPAPAPAAQVPAATPSAPVTVTPAPTTTHGSSGSAPGHTQTSPARGTSTTPGNPIPPGNGNPYGRGGKHATTVPAG